MGEDTDDGKRARQYAIRREQREQATCEHDQLARQCELCERNAECPGIAQGLSLGECCRQSAALAAVRAVLSPPQDTAGISRGGDAE